jgi:peroxiredoxin Q/BCP
MAVVCHIPAMKTKMVLVMSLLFGLGAGLYRAEAMPKAGDTAPPFSGTDQNGNAVSLQDLCRQGKIVLLYFYPKDFTGGCTKEACGFRDRLGELQTNNVVVIGVSHDSAASHQKFAAAYHLNFSLLADPDDKLIKEYDVKMPMLEMAKRVSFLIAPDGKIVHVTDAMNPQTHFDEMKAALAALKKS